MFAARNAFFAGRPLVPVTFDVLGAGNQGSNSFSSSTAFTWAHNAIGNAATVGVNSQGNGPQTHAVTYNGVAMTLLGNIQYVATGTSHYAMVSLWGMLNPPTGSKTVSATVSQSSNLGISGVGNSMSYKNVASFGTAVTNNGSGTALSVSSVASQLGGMVAAALASRSTETISAFNQTSRYNLTGSVENILLGDAPGAASVNFTATISASDTWGAVAVPLIPV